MENSLFLWNCLDRKVENMAIVLTNGTYYIRTSQTGKIQKTDNIMEAQTFYSCNAAMRKVFKAPGKCKNYYPFDTEDGYKSKRVRKKYSSEERKTIYDISNGCCELCGRKLLFQDMTLDHVVPLSMGGKDEMENLQSSCLLCNQIKSNILPEKFIERISLIYLYQMEKKYKCKLGWEIVHRMLNKMD